MHYKKNALRLLALLTLTVLVSHFSKHKLFTENAHAEVQNLQLFENLNKTLDVNTTGNRIESI